jgi:hypothetical protein
LVALNHLTVPVAILLLQDAQMRVVPTREDRRASLIRFQRCLGEWSRFGAINKQIDCSNGRRLRGNRQNSKEIRAMLADWALPEFAAVDAVKAPGC